MFYSFLAFGNPFGGEVFGVKDDASNNMNALYRHQLGAQIKKDCVFNPNVYIHASETTYFWWRSLISWLILAGSLSSVHLVSF